ncbi:MAG: DUF86 domain-containing protein [Chloroflexi bacterium]|nr:DUF86 domain-containing protein [Chloroflexota bacterium]
MLDGEQVLARVDRLQGYLRELRQTVPSSFEAYQRELEKRRACERLIQLAIEAATDVCGLLVAGLRLGLPGDEADLFTKLADAGVLSPATVETLRRMRGFRNILVHEYTRIDDRVVYTLVSQHLGDFDVFIRQVLEHIR